MLPPSQTLALLDHINIVFTIHLNHRCLLDSSFVHSFSNQHMCRVKAWNNFHVAFKRIDTAGDRRDQHSSVQVPEMRELTALLLYDLTVIGILGRDCYNTY